MFVLLLTSAASLILKFRSIRTPPNPHPRISMHDGASYWVTSQWIVLRKPLTLMHDDTLVPFSIVDGTSLRQPPKIVSHSSKRLRSEANAQA